MELQEAIDFWTDNASPIPDVDPPLWIDSTSVPGWVVALRCPSETDEADPEPYIEMWQEGDFIAETEVYAQALGVSRVS